MTTQTAASALNERIRHAMSEQAVSQEALASVLGISQRQVSDRVRGVVEWRGSELAIVSDHLGITLTFGGAPRAEAGRVDVETVLAVLAVVAAFTIGLNFVGPHYVTAVLVLASSIGVLCFYLGVLVTVPKAMPQPRRAGTDRTGDAP